MAGQPQPAAVVVVSSGVVVTERLDGPLQGGDARLEAVRESRGESVQQQIDRPGRHRRWRCCLGSCGRLEQPAAAGEVTGVEGRLERLRVSLAGQRGVQRAQRLGGVEQHPRHVAPARGVERDLRAQQLEAGTLKPVQPAGRRGQATASAGAPGRARQLRGDVLVGAEHACARCQARRSGSDCGSVAAASAPCARRRSGGVAAW